jgi:hypothetical protein
MIKRTMLAAALLLFLLQPVFCETVTGPYIQNVTTGSAVIQFSFEKETAGYLVYGTTTGMEISILFTGKRRYAIKLENLLAGTVYYYTLRDNKGEPLTGLNDTWFVTDSGRPAYFTTVVIGDTFSAPDEENSHHMANIEAIATHSFPSIMLHTGDIVKDNRPESWQTYFFIERDILKQVPVYPVAGNNDPETELFLERFTLPGDRPFYTFEYNTIRYIALDIRGGKKEIQQSILNDRSEQWRWLQSLLEDKAVLDAEFTIVLFHLPLYPLDGPERTDLVERLYPFFSGAGVDLVFSSGHYYSSRFEKGTWHVITGGGGAPLTEGITASREDRAYYSQHHHCRLEFDNGIMTVSVVNQNGGILDSIIVYPESEDEIADADNGDSSMERGGIKVSVYSTENCDYCDVVKDVVLPALFTKINKDYVDTYYNMSDPLVALEFKKLEANLDDSGNRLPAIVIDGMIFGGQGEIEGMLPDYINETYGEDKKVGIPMLPLLILFLTVLAASLVTILALRRKVNR